MFTTTLLEIVIIINNNNDITLHTTKMPHYIVLVNWTDQGIRNVKDSPKRAEDFKNSVEKAGGRLIGLYYTMGQYDSVAILEAPNDETAMSILLASRTLGNIRTVTLKAFPISEAGEIFEELS
jgi:uncharacterized protein with GYD domain